MDDETYSSADEVVSVIPKQSSELNKNDNVMIKNRPCKILEVSTSDDTVHAVGTDLFRWTNLEETWSSSENVDVPIVKRYDYALMDIEDGLLTLMGETDKQIREDLKLPGGQLGDQIKEAFEAGKSVLVTAFKAAGEEGVVSFRFA